MQKTYSLLLTALPIVRQNDAVKSISSRICSDNLFFTYNASLKIFKVLDSK